MDNIVHSLWIGNKRVYGIIRVFHPSNGARVWYGNKYTEFEEGDYTSSWRFLSSTPGKNYAV